MTTTTVLCPLWGHLADANISPNVRFALPLAVVWTAYPFHQLNLVRPLRGPVAADPQGDSYVQQLACEEDRPFSRYLLNRAGRDCAAADEQKSESALTTSIGRTLVRADRRRKPLGLGPQGPDRAEPNVRTDVSRADLPKSPSGQSATKRHVRDWSAYRSKYTRLSRLWRRSLFLLLGRRACRRDHGNAKKCRNANAERNHDRSSPLAHQPQYAGTESFAFASLIVIATLRCAVTGATRACA